MQATKGSYRTIITGEFAIPWYIIPFDKDGNCKAPATLAMLMELLKRGSFTNIFLFSHGWNNDWSTASKRYNDFIDGFMSLRKSMQIDMPNNYRPILIGVFWPSTSLVLPWEKGPRFATINPSSTEIVAQDSVYEDLDHSICHFAEDLPKSSVERFYALANADSLDIHHLEELAALILPAMDEGNEQSADLGDAADTAKTWISAVNSFRKSRNNFYADESENFGTIAALNENAEPIPAGILDAIDPRHALRLATVWKMKDRAGKVGAKGVHQLLYQILQHTQSKVHLIGHSYGCKLLLSAVAASELPRPVSSGLLLQPAISYLAFASDVDGDHHAGGYCATLADFLQPLMCTFSHHDFALANVFHLAVRRKRDLGELKIATVPPSEFAALGGYGPGTVTTETKILEIRDPGQIYSEIRIPGVKLIALQSSRVIKGHGDILQPAVWWALHQQLTYS